MPKKSNPLENNVNYQIGVQKGNTIVRFIEQTIYKTLEIALEAKKGLNAMLASELGYDGKNKEYVENLGIIAVLEEAIKNKK